ncbi:MAG: VWA domain-containing protein, partial [Bacteroidetes bacterium]|nr:VWA domain-containing protein [Bacteroidota bacterium]
MTILSKSTFFSRFLILFLMMIWFADSALGQYGYSSAALSMGRQRSENYIIPHPNEIVVEEYYNYHKHQIPLPHSGKSVNLDLRLGNPSVGEEGLLQVGIATTTGDDYYETPAVNIGLVIDRSGSMQGEKLHKTKQALLALVNHLKPSDKISMIAFDHEAQILLPAQEVGNKYMVRSAINNLQTRGS